MATVRTKPITEEELLRMSADRPVEVVNGEVIPAMTAASIAQIFVIRNLFKLLDDYAGKHELGYVLPDGLHYILRDDSEGIKGSRIPDVSFIRKGRMTESLDPNKPFRGAPDLAVEVVSPSESDETTLDKVRDYLAAGTEQAWILYPSAEELHVYQRDDPKSIRVYSGDDILEAETLFPGLKLAVKAIFVIPTGPRTKNRFRGAPDSG